MKANYTFYYTIWQKHKKQIIGVYLLNTIEELAYLLLPIAVGAMIDSFFYNKGNGLWLFLACYIAWQGMATLRKVMDTVVFTKMFSEISLEVLQNHKQKNIDTSRTTAHLELMKKVVHFFEEDVPFTIKSLVSIVGTCILLYSYNFKLMLVALLILLPSLFVNNYFSKKLQTASQNVHDQYEQQLSMVQSQSQAIQTKYFQDLRQKYIKKSNLEAANFGVIELFVLSMITISVYIVCKTNGMGYGSIVASYGLILRLAYGFDFIPHITSKWAELKDIAQRLNEL